MSDTTARNLLLVPAVRLGFVGLTFISTLIVVRTLGRAEFGYFAVCLAFVKICSGCIGDSLDLAVLRAVPVYLKTDRERALDILRGAFSLRVAAGLGVLLLAGLFGSRLAGVFLDSATAGPLVVLAAAGVLGELLCRAVSGYLQASELFTRYLLIEGALQATRLGLLVGLVGSNLMSFPATLAVYVAAPCLVFGFGVRLLPRDVVRPLLATPRVLAEVFHYSKWVLAAMAMAAVYERLDVLLLRWLRSAEEVAVYSAAFTLASFPDLVVAGISAVLYPKVSAVYLQGRFRAFHGRYLRWSIPAGLMAGLGAATFGRFFIELLFSERYLAAVPVFHVLVVGTLFGMVATPLPAALVAFVAPRWLVMLSALGLALTAAGGIATIPALGSLGAAWVVLGVRVVLGTTILVCARILEGRADVLAGSTSCSPPPSQDPGRAWMTGQQVSADAKVE